MAALGTKALLAHVLLLAHHGNVEVVNIHVLLLTATHRHTDILLFQTSWLPLRGLLNEEEKEITSLATVVTKVPSEDEWRN
jgi:hypothetical protein